MGQINIQFTTTYHNPGYWPEEIEALATHAAKAGWYISSSWEKLLCKTCNEESMNVEF